MNEDKPSVMPPVPPFVRFVASAVPMAFDDSLSYYEALCALWKYVQGMTDVINNNATLEEEYILKFNELKTFVDTYFDNLDVQDEINNKLDQMVTDGTFAELFSLMYPVKDEETGVVNAFFEYGDVKRYGAVCDGTTDDKAAIRSAINCAQILNIPVHLHGVMYVSETINTHGVTMIGDKQPYASGASYPNGIGYDYPKNRNDGASITFADYIETIPDGTCIVSDVAEPILSTDYDKGFKLNNFGVYGWLRNTSQIGVEVESNDEATYYQGHHEFNNFSVFNTGSHGIHLYSLETTDINNLRIDLTNGYGLYIEGLSDVDTPIDYVTFRDSRIRHTRLHGIYMYNSARKNIRFEDCNFNYIGQYDFGEVNDTYGNRTLPVSNSAIMYGISINGLNDTGSGNQLRYIELVDNYGEASLGFFNCESISTIVGLKVKDNSFTKLAGASVSCYIRLTASYLYDSSFNYITSNYDTIYDVANINEIRTDEFVSDQLYNVLTSTKVFKNSNKYGAKAFKEIYGNKIIVKEVVKPYNSFTALCTSSSSVQNITVDITTYIDEYLKANQVITNGHALLTALLTICNAANASSASKADLITCERHNGKHFVGFVTNNTGATATDAGVISITVPAYKVATLQILQAVDTDIQQ